MDDVTGRDEAGVAAGGVPRLSLIVGTLGRGAQLERLFRSLAAQTCAHFEVVLVDQNPPGTLESLLAPYRDRLAITHLASAPGLSRARNVGLAHCRASLIAFPDDDCWYPPSLVGDVVRGFAARPDLAALTGRTLDADGRESLGRFHATDLPITKHSVWFAGNSNSLFVRRDTARAVGGFDEALGVGAPTPFKSGEETDFLLRILDRGGSAAFRRDLVVHHDQVAQAGGASSDRRAIDYSRGFGRVLRLHGYGVAYLALRLARSAAGGGIAALRLDGDAARYKALWAIGTLRGYLDPLPPASMAGAILSKPSAPIVPGAGGPRIPADGGVLLPPPLTLRT